MLVLLGTYTMDAGTPGFSHRVKNLLAEIGLPPSWLTADSQTPHIHRVRTELDQR